MVKEETKTILVATVGIVFGMYFAFIGTSMLSTWLSNDAHTLLDTSFLLGGLLFFAGLVGIGAVFAWVLEVT